MLTSLKKKFSFLSPLWKLEVFPEIPVYKELHAKVNFNGQQNSDSCTQDPAELWQELWEEARFAATHAATQAVQRPDVDLTCNPGAAMVISFEVPTGPYFQRVVSAACVLSGIPRTRHHEHFGEDGGRGWISVGG